MLPSFQYLQDSLNPDSPFLITQHRTYTYGDLTAYAQLLKSKLPAKRDLRAALLAELNENVVLTIASCWLLDIPVIPVSPDTDQSEWQRIIRELAPDILLGEISQLSSVQSQSIAYLPLPSLSSSTDSPDSFDNIRSHPEHVFGYFLTSGTSGTSKIVPLKRRQFIWGAEASAANFKPEPGELWLLSLPLYHVGGVSIIIRSLLYGSGVYLLPKFQPEIIRKLLGRDNRIRFCSLVPTMLRRVLSDTDFHPHSEFKMALLGGGPMSAPLIEESLQRKMIVATSFGMTETAAQIAAHVYRDIEKPLRLNAGSIFSPNQAEARDEKGKPLIPGNEGILWIRGPQVFDGYLAKELNAAYFDSDGWFCTGDHARAHTDGEIEILMRRTDRIVTGGENVNPVEIERVLLEHPDIIESAVFGLPDDEWGQRVVALIVRNRNTETIPDLDEYLSDRLKKFQVPKEIFAVPELPYTRTGKIDRSRLPEWFKKWK